MAINEIVSSKWQSKPDRVKVNELLEFEDSDYDYLDEIKQDPAEISAVEDLERLFNENQEKVFYSRQLEVKLEEKYFHWITNRALRELISQGRIRSEKRELYSGGIIHLLWHRDYRYWRRAAKKVQKIVEEYAAQRIAESVGCRGESIVLEAFSRFEFIQKGRSAQAYREKQWTESGHNLDFIFEKEGEGYGIEVKNTLGYMAHTELEKKISMCKFLNLRPVFVCRMIPKTWVHEIIQAGGYAMILKYQIYPVLLKELAMKLRNELGLPVDTPRALEEGTMKRFERWRNRP